MFLWPFLSKYELMGRERDRIVSISVYLGAKLEGIYG